MKKQERHEKATATDHLVVAFLNAIVAFATGTLLWLALNGVPAGWAGWLPFQAVIWFTAAVVIAGVFVREVWLADFLALIWRGLANWFGRA